MCKIYEYFLKMIKFGYLGYKLIIKCPWYNYTFAMISFYIISLTVYHWNKLYIHLMTYQCEKLIWMVIIYGTVPKWVKMYPSWITNTYYALYLFKYYYDLGYIATFQYFKNIH